MITYNRLEYTKKALEALVDSDCGDIYIIDNGSTDWTKEWLGHFVDIDLTQKISLFFNDINYGIAHAMNEFLDLTKDYEFVAKVDNDTIVPKDWCQILADKMIHRNIDMMQSKHHIIPATHPGGWEGFVKNMKRDAADKSIYYNSFIGGSGIVFRRDKVDKIPETEWKIGGWREFQRQHPELKKAFCNEVSIELLDSHGYEDYPQYYKQTGRAI